MKRFGKAKHRIWNKRSGTGTSWVPDLFGISRLDHQTGKFVTAFLGAAKPCQKHSSGMTGFPVPQEAEMKYNDTRMILPFMGPFYDRIAIPMAYIGLRLIVGGMLVVAGWPKIAAPFAMGGFVESLGLYPGWFWSPFLAVLEFVGGLFIIAGFLTRPVALASGIMLGVTYWFHVNNPFGAALLTPEGIAAIAENTAYYTAEGLNHMAQDGGAQFLQTVQSKTTGLSAMWAVAALVLAAFGAGPLSVDRTILKREF